MRSPNWIRRLFQSTDTSSHQNAQENPNTSQPRDDRVHARYLLEGAGLARASLPSGAIGYVKDLSYGGLAIQFPRDAKIGEIEPGKTVPITLSILDRSIECKCAAVRVANQGEATVLIAFSLVHEKPESLLFIRDMIEPLRCGRTCALLAPEIRGDRYKASSWVCLRGDGPIDVNIQSSSAGLEQAFMSFRIGGVYHEISYENGKLVMGKTVGESSSKNGAIALVSRTQGAELQVWRHAAFNLIGASVNHREAVTALLEVVLHALQLDTRTFAA